jgi:hypothetical protein
MSVNRAGDEVPPFALEVVEKPVRSRFSNRDMERIVHSWSWIPKQL